MTTTDNNTTQPQLIVVSRLEKSPHNARRTGAGVAIEELKASILAHGLMQNLVATDAGDGTYRVIAGGRRLDAIRSLQAEGKLPQDYAVPCQVVSDDHALEMSLAENTVRLAMHPADQYEAFAALIDQGATAAEVAQRFGVEESLVVKRMKLARVAPQLLAEYRNDGLSLESLMTFTLTDDHRRQLKVFKSLPDWHRDNHRAIRDALTEKMIEAGDKLARFIGIDAYLAAGGSTRADLFSDEVYLEKPALLHKLAEQKLAAIRTELEAEGWGWIEVNFERDFTTISRCERLRPQLFGAPAELLDLKAGLDTELEQVENALGDAESDDLLEQQHLIQQRLAEAEKELAAFVGFDSEQKKLAGCFVSIGQDGTPFCDKGLVKPEQRRQLAKLLGTDDGKPVRVKPKHALPETLRRDLAACRLQVAQVEITKHPEIAIDLLAFHAASTMLGEQSGYDGPHVEFRRPRLNAGSKMDSTTAAQALTTLATAFPTAWLKPPSEAARFEAFRCLPAAERLKLLAYSVALTLRPKLAPAEGDEATAYDAALALTEGSVATYWRPDKDSFLARLTRDQLMAIARDTLGEAWAQPFSKVKKTELVEALGRAFSEPEQSGRPRDVAEKLKSWLPAGMSFDAIPASKPAKPKKARKAA
jgi:ParB family chromosome partitioning protein